MTKYNNSVCGEAAVTLLGNEEIWDKRVRDTADKRIEEYKKLNKD